MEESRCIQCLGPLDESAYRNSAGLQLCSGCFDIVAGGPSLGSAGRWIPTAIGPEQPSSNGVSAEL